MKNSIPSLGAGFIAPVAGAFIVDIALHGWSVALARLPWFAGRPPGRAGRATVA